MGSWDVGMAQTMAVQWQDNTISQVVYTSVSGGCNGLGRPVCRPTHGVCRWVPAPVVVECEIGLLLSHQEECSGVSRGGLCQVIPRLPDSMLVLWSWAWWACPLASQWCMQVLAVIDRGGVIFRSLSECSGWTSSSCWGKWGSFLWEQL